MTPENIKDNWPAFDIRSWKIIPSFSGKIASESDAKKGAAVFCIKDVNFEHIPFKIELPKLAYLIDSENKNKELVVLIQAESTSQGVVVGYRNPLGGNGACFFYELELLDEKEIENILIQNS